MSLKDIKCKFCNAELELSFREKISGRFKCPNCNKNNFRIITFAASLITVIAIVYAITLFFLFPLGRPPGDGVQKTGRSYDEYISIADELFNRGQYAGAKIRFEQALSKRPGDPHVLQRINEIENKLAELRVRLGSIEIKTRPSGAAIYVDGLRKGSSPAKFSLPVGEYRLTVEKQGYFPTQKKIIVNDEKQSIMLDINMQRSTVIVEDSIRSSLADFDLVDKKIESLKKANIAFNVQDTMYVKNSYPVLLLMSIGIPKEKLASNLNNS